MTAEEADDVCLVRHKPVSPPTVAPSEWPVEMNAIFENLQQQNNIVFKSQQIDDPELLREQKLEAAKSIFARNRQTFLQRFGSFMNSENLETFSQLIAHSLPLKPEESHDEILLMIGDYEKRLKTRRRDVRNRRFAKMQQLIKQGDYFSEQEMMRRQPELYDELIGQYLSEVEKKQRDSYDVKNTTFSGILMHSLEQQQVEDVMAAAQQQQLAIEAKNEDDNDITAEEESHNNPITEAEDEIPVSFRNQWGNFDNEQIACSSSRADKLSKKSNSLNSAKTKLLAVITAGERDLLRQEFLGIMHEKFLEGQDADFDYAQVDDDTLLDDLQLLNQDKEDQYFQESDDENEVEARQISEQDSEDELDIYMNHLSKHHSLQN